MIGGGAVEPLSGVKVLDLTRYVVGAITTRRLADLGADVVKVESAPHGDMLRSLPPRGSGESIWHALENAGKSSVCGDPADRGHREFVSALADEAEVIVTSGNAGYGRRLNVDLPLLRERRASLIHCDIVPFGAGLWQEIPAHGNNLDALGGCGQVTGHNGREVMAPAIYGGISNELGAHHAVTAIIAALFRVAREGTGASLTVSCWEAAVEANRVRVLFEALAAPGDAPIDEQVDGSRHAVYRSADGRPLYFSAVDAPAWQRFADATAHPELAAEWPRGRQVDYGEPALSPAIAAVFRERDAAQWMRLSVTARLAATPLLSPREVLESGQLARSGLLGSSAAGQPSLAGPVRWDAADRPGGSRDPAPDLGADTAAVRDRWLGVREQPPAPAEQPSTP
jgi:crotonobetainyl-CoA:carnitine CoA-transferase CaiB-like acyl-CoA transferase